MANTFKNASAINVSNSGSYGTAVVTGASSTQTLLHAVYITNKSANAITYDAWIYDASATAYAMISNDVSVPSQSTLILDKPLNLEASDVLYVKASAASAMDVFVSILEIT